jgi:hypothetical protein
VGSGAECSAIGEGLEADEDARRVTRRLGGEHGGGGDAEAGLETFQRIE